MSKINIYLRTSMFLALSGLTTNSFTQSLEECTQMDTTNSKKIQSYISQQWDNLTRTHHDLLTIAKDPKINHKPDTPWPVYIPATISISDVQRSLQNKLTNAEYSKIDLRILPEDTNKLKGEGLLYLPNSYVVPGGRFNEMYGWDSYFIILGLLHDQRLELAKGIVENFKFEIDHYGKILNANRTYYLTRSQPPLFTQMVLAIYHKTQDKNWLESMLPSITKYYQYWATEPRLVSEIGLSRYYPDGDGPAFEVLNTTSKLESTYYTQAKNFLRTHTKNSRLKKYYDPQTQELTREFYKADRAIRESGLDLTGQYGPFGVYITENISVALNVLLYQMEMDTAEINKILANDKEQSAWKNRAQTRAQLIEEYLWDEKTGFYFDYNFITKKHTKYPSLISYYPLWAGLANATQAQKLYKNIKHFKAQGGLVSSTKTSGHQWDAPFGWAPLHYFVVKGLHRYGYHNDAECIKDKFTSMIGEVFQKHGTLFEKYNVQNNSVNTDKITKFGYSENVVGFGWTNGVYLEFIKLSDVRNRNITRNLQR